MQREVELSTWICTKVEVCKVCSQIIFTICGSGPDNIVIAVCQCERRTFQQLAILINLVDCEGRCMNIIIFGILLVIAVDEADVVVITHCQFDASSRISIDCCSHLITGYCISCFAQCQICSVSNISCPLICEVIGLCSIFQSEIFTQTCDCKACRNFFTCQTIELLCHSDGTWLCCIGIAEGNDVILFLGCYLQSSRCFNLTIDC